MPIVLLMVLVITMLPRSLSACFFGRFLGALLGGWLFDRPDSYDLAWMIAAALGVMAGLAHLPIDERPVERNVLRVGQV